MFSVTYPPILKNLENTGSNIALHIPTTMADNKIKLIIHDQLNSKLRSLRSKSLPINWIAIMLIIMATTTEIVIEYKCQPRRSRATGSSKITEILVK